MVINGSARNSVVACASALFFASRLDRRSSASVTARPNRPSSCLENFSARCASSLCVPSILSGSPTKMRCGRHSSRSWESAAQSGTPSRAPMIVSGCAVPERITDGNADIAQTEVDGHNRFVARCRHACPASALSRSMSIPSVWPAAANRSAASQ